MLLTKYISYLHLSLNTLLLRCIFTVDAETCSIISIKTGDEQRHISNSFGNAFGITNPFGIYKVYPIDGSGSSKYIYHHKLTMHGYIGIPWLFLERNSNNSWMVGLKFK